MMTDSVSSWQLTVAEVVKLGTVLLAIAALYYGLSARVTVLEVQLTELSKQLDRSQEDVRGLERFLIDWARTK